MPQLYNAAVITDVGIALLNRAQAGEVSIQFTRMAVGNGVYREEEKTLSQLQKSTSLRSEKNSYPLSSVNIISDNSVKLTAIITNQDLVTEENLVANGYYINEMGLYAKEKDGDSSTEVLYSIVTTAAENGDYMPPYNGHTPAQIIQEYYTTISNSEDVTIYLKDTGAVMLAEEAEKRFQKIYEAIPRVDSELNNDSDNPVQNKVIASRIAELALQVSTAWEDLKQYTDTKIAALINGAPETLDTLKEVADAIKENETIVEALDAAIGNKVDKVAGKGLSTNDFTMELENKLNGIQTGANKNIQTDWNVTDINSDAFIKNKPTIPTKTSHLINDSEFKTSITAKDIINALGYTPASISDNLLLDPIGLNIDYWNFSNCEVTRGQADPIGGMNAIKLTPTGGDGVFETSSINRPLKTIGTRYKFSVWLKADSECEGAIVMRHNKAGIMTKCQLTTVWKEYLVEATLAEEYPLTYSQAVVGGWNTFTEGHPDIYCPKVTFAS